MVETFTIGGFQTNTYVISNDNKECIIVDPSLDYKPVYKYVDEKYTVKAILLTHAHLDHIDGAKYYNNIPVYLYKSAEKMLYDSHSSLYDIIGKKTPFKKGDLNIIPLTDKQSFNLIGFNIEVMHTPGHTEGSCVYLINGDLFTGDTLFCGTCGRTDFPTGDAEAMLKSLNRIIATYPDDTKVYPGHDRETTIAYEKKYNYYLKER